MKRRNGWVMQRAFQIGISEGSMRSIGQNALDTGVWNWYLDGGDCRKAVMRGLAPTKQS